MCALSQAQHQLRPFRWNESRYTNSKLFLVEVFEARNLISQFCDHLQAQLPQGSYKYTAFTVRNTRCFFSPFFLRIPMCDSRTHENIIVNKSLLFSCYAHSHTLNGAAVFRVDEWNIRKLRTFTQYTRTKHKKWNSTKRWRKKKHKNQITF